MGKNAQKCYGALIGFQVTFLRETQAVHIVINANVALKGFESRGRGIGVLNVFDYLS